MKTLSILAMLIAVPVLAGQPAAVQSVPVVATQVAVPQPIIQAAPVVAQNIGVSVATEVEVGQLAEQEVQMQVPVKIKLRPQVNTGVATQAVQATNSPCTCMACTCVPTAPMVQVATPGVGVQVTPPCTGPNCVPVVPQQAQVDPGPGPRVGILRRVWLRRVERRTSKGATN